VEEYRALIDDPIAKRLGVARALKPWDPLLQATYQAPRDRGVEALARQMALPPGDLSVALKDLHDGTAGPSAALRILSKEILGLDLSQSVKEILSHPELANNQRFQVIVDQALRGIPVVLGSIHNLRRAAEELRAATDLLTQRRAQALSPAALSQHRPSLAFPDRTVAYTNDVRGAALAAHAVATYLGDRKAAEQAAKLAQQTEQVIQIYQACQLILAAGSGVGTFMAFAAIVGGFASLSGSSANSGTAAQLDATVRLFDYLKIQFEIVNAKLDTIIARLAGIDARLYRIEATLQRVDVTVAQLNEQLGDITERLRRLEKQGDDSWFHLSRLVLDTGAGGCVGQIESQSITTKDSFGSCLGVLLNLGLHSTRAPLIRFGNERPAREQRLDILRDLATKEYADAIDFSREFRTIAGEYSHILRDQRLDNVPNPGNYASLWKAAQYLSILSSSHPAWFREIRDDPRQREVQEQIRRLYLLSRSSEASMRELSGANDGPLGVVQRLLDLTALGYVSALNRASSWIEDARNFAAQQYVADLQDLYSEVRSSANQPWLEEVDLQKIERASLTVHDCRNTGAPGVAVDKSFLRDRKNVTPAVVAALALGVDIRVCMFFDTKSELSRENCVLTNGMVLVAGKLIYTRYFVGQSHLGKGRIASTATFEECVKHSYRMVSPAPFKRTIDGKEVHFGYTFKENLAAMLADKTVTAAVAKEGATLVGWVDDSTIRAAFHRYFVRYLMSHQSPHNRGFNEVKRELTAMRGLLKAHMVLALPGVWATHDAVQLFLDGQVTTKLVDGESLEAMLLCPNEHLCQRGFLSLVEKLAVRPYWWDPDESTIQSLFSASGVSPTAANVARLKRAWHPLSFGNLLMAVNSQLEAWRTILHKRIDWSSVSVGYHPALFSSASRLQGVAQAVNAQ
jgi:hypothetical protein